MSEPKATAWWHPSAHDGRRPLLLARNRIVAALRAFFIERGFIEVEAAALQISPGNEAHLHAFATELVEGDRRSARRYLHTSPEFACKKLLAAGERRIFTLARVFRNGERSALHHPEFTMLEWYRAGEPCAALMQDCAEILALAAAVCGQRRFSFRGCAADPFERPDRLSVAEAFARHAGIDLLATLDADGVPDREALARAATGAGLRVTPDDDWSDLFSGILVQRVEPRLGEGRATLLTDYPAAEAALARRQPHDPRLAERFELYACGIELANAFGELTDADEQRRRFEQEMAEKARVYGERYPIDEAFLAALRLMPEASGIALGLDRLVMLATGAMRIEQVMWTPIDPIGADASRQTPVTPRTTPPAAHTSSGS